MNIAIINIAKIVTKKIKDCIMQKKENKIILYQNNDEIVRMSIRFAYEDLWLTQNQLAEIYCTTQQNISQHIDNISKVKGALQLLKQ